MPPKTAAIPQPHMGRNIERIRTIKGIKQDVLAKQLGIDQSALSRIESSAEVDEDRLQQIADALKMSVESIRNFSEERVVNYIQNNYDNSKGGPLGESAGDHSSNGNRAENQNNHFNATEKLFEVMEKQMAELVKRIEFLEEMLKKK